MNPTDVMLAGKLDELGDSLLETFGDWGEAGLKVALTVLVLAAIVRQFSIKAAIGAVLGLIVVLSLYASRNDLAGMFSDEVKNPANGAGSVTLVISPVAPADGSEGAL